jgi:hypothetical protein
VSDAGDLSSIILGELDREHDDVRASLLQFVALAPSLEHTHRRVALVRALSAHLAPAS